MTVLLRPARSTDAGRTGEILFRFATETDWMPELYTMGETIGFCGVMIDRGWVKVVEIDDQVEGFLARDGEEICALYMSRRGRRQGVGPMLLDDAKAGSQRLVLRALEANAGAQRFYRRNGFVETARSDGSLNDEKMPDITYVWTMEQPNS